MVMNTHNRQIIALHVGGRGTEADAARTPGSYGTIFQLPFNSRLASLLTSGKRTTSWMRISTLLLVRIKGSSIT